MAKNKAAKLEDVIKPDAILSDGNYDNVLTDNLLENLKKWDKSVQKSEKVDNSNNWRAGQKYQHSAKNYSSQSKFH